MRRFRTRPSVRTENGPALSQQGASFKKRPGKTTASSMILSTRHMLRSLLSLSLGFVLVLPAFAEKEKPLPREYLPAPYDAYFRARVEALSSPDWIKDITPANWPERRAAMRAELARMLGL